MTAPLELSMEALLAEDGMPVSAGLPDGLRRQLEQVAAAREQRDRAAEKRRRVERLLAQIGEHEARIRELHDQLREAVRDYTEAAAGLPAA